MEGATMDKATMEQATIEEQTNAEVLDATTFTLYIPDFVHEYSLSGKILDEQNTQLLRKGLVDSWPGLIVKLELCFLTLLRSTVMMTTSVIQLPSNARLHSFFLADICLLASNKLIKWQMFSLATGLSRRRCTPK
jgi:hypothetical protein